MVSLSTDAISLSCTDFVIISQYLGVSAPFKYATSALSDKKKKSVSLKGNTSDKNDTAQSFREDSATVEVSVMNLRLNADLTADDLY